MKKIPSLFVRDFTSEPKLVTRTVTPGCEWVTNGEGITTEKLDGTACMVRDGVLWKRYDAKHGKSPPPGFEPAQEPDTKTGHWPGWVKVGAEPDSRWHVEAFAQDLLHPPSDGTYELIGPRINGNPYGAEQHTLVRHGALNYGSAPDLRNYDEIRAWLAVQPTEGLVWHHPDGRMAKIKRSDFGFAWPVRSDADL